jgi:Holliday junction DNA helicase RuvB
MATPSKRRLANSSPAASTPVERIIAGRVQTGEDTFEGGLRPRRLEDYVGQARVVENLRIAIRAAQGRNEPLDHILFHGPPGLGKTTLAFIMAAEMGVSVKVTAGPSITRPGDLAAILTNLQPHDLLFVDEFHRLPRVVEEVLYPVMEDRALHIVIGKGPGAHTVRLSLPPFTLVGATTRYALLSSPLRDRFGATYRLDFYTPEEIATILRRSARVLGVKATEDGIQEVAQRSRGTPRVANRLLRRVRDYAEVMGDGVLTGPAAREALDKLGVDALGLDEIDHKVLRSLVENFDGGPVGLETLASSIAEEPDTVMDVYEPYSLQLGFLERTPRGRRATRRAYEHLGLPYPEAAPSFNGVAESADEGQGRMF